MANDMASDKQSNYHDTVIADHANITFRRLLVYDDSSVSSLQSCVIE